jgi:hypothetical protein
MNACRALLAALLLQSGLSLAAGWHDYSLEIAPGFFVYRMNSFDICLGLPDGNLLICPEKYPGVGPLTRYAVTDKMLFTRHFGVRPNERNPSVPEGDPNKEYYFAVVRATHHVTGPLTRDAWERTGLPTLSSLQWAAPKNPNFWTPLIGNVSFLVFVLVVYGWPYIAAVVVIAASIWLYRRRVRKGPDAA